MHPNCQRFSLASVVLPLIDHSLLIATKTRNFNKDRHLPVNRWDSEVDEAVVEGLGRWVLALACRGHDVRRHDEGALPRRRAGAA